MDDPVHFWWISGMCSRCDRATTRRSSFWGRPVLVLPVGSWGPSPYPEASLWPTRWGTQHCRGVVGGFLISLIFGATGPEILPLLIGGGCSGLLGIWAVQFWSVTRGFKRTRRLVWSLVLFWPGHCSLERGPNLFSTQTAGLDSYIYGQASAMTRVDVLALATISLLVGLISIFLRTPSVKCASTPISPQPPDGLLIESICS